MAEPFLETSDLFVAGQQGYALYRIPGIVVTTRGTILAYCEARRSASGDWGAIDIFLRRSIDGGQTWSPVQRMNPSGEVISKNPVALRQGLASPEERTFNNPVAIPDRQTGSVYFLYCAEYARCFAMRSDDDGQSWTDPVEITATFEPFRKHYDWRVLATGPGHGIQLTNGRLLVPVWLSTGTGGHAHRPSCVSVITSDDHGQSWERGEIIARDSGHIPNPSETTAVQLQDGRVMVNIRSESRRNRRLVAFSDDGATGWSEPSFDDALFEPVCFASLARLSQQPPHNRNRLIFVHPDSRESAGFDLGQTAQPRENLTIRLSYDEGQTWPIAKVLDPGVGGYADLASRTDYTILCLYERGSTGISMFQTGQLTLARFNLAWLTDGLDTGL
jgi:sialidase-1